MRSRGLEKNETDGRNSHEPQKVYRTFLEEEEEEEYDDEDGEEGEDVRAAKGKRGPPCVKLREGRWKRRCTRPHSLDLGALLSHTPAAPHTAQVRHNQRWLALTRLTVIQQSADCSIKKLRFEHWVSFTIFSVVSNDHPSAVTE